jgi:predicted nucleic acid-binding protein
MELNLTMDPDIFLDTSYALALVSEDDTNHATAVELSIKLESAQMRLITTWAVLLEIGNALSKRKERGRAITLIATILSDPQVQVVSLTDDLLLNAFELYKLRSDKDWGLIDCLSFVVMQRYGIKSALTADHHFVQAGFSALLPVAK